MVVVAQLVRASDCGSESRRFESGLPPNSHPQFFGGLFFVCEQHKEHNRKFSIRILSVSNNINLFFSEYN